LQPLRLTAPAMKRVLRKTANSFLMRSSPFREVERDG
jgi:hypothetical protein